MSETSLSKNKTSKNKIDMNHGFMKSIIRNQHDRDNYDKEMKLMAEIKTQTGVKMNRKNEKNKIRKVDAPIYTPPTRSNISTVGQDETNKERDRKYPVLKVEFQDKDDTFHFFYVYEDSNLKALSQSFGKKIGLSQDLVNALHFKLVNEFSSCKT